jgi:hypothetical protein
VARDMSRKNKGEKNIKMSLEISVISHHHRQERKQLSHHCPPPDGLSSIAQTEIQKW